MGPRVMLLVSGGTQTWRPMIVAHPESYGVLAVPRDRNVLPSCGRWAGDNGAFGSFNEAAFLAMLQRHRAQRGRCLFVAAPDVVGDATSTLALLDVWGPRVRAEGYPVALVAQNGLRAGVVPWGAMDSIFIGGALECLTCGYVRPARQTNRACPACRRRLAEWKVGADAAGIAAAARARGLWLHMGRVNTASRLRYAAAIGCDSVDGSGWSRYPADMLQNYGGVLASLRGQGRIEMGHLQP